ncbi:MAG: magnesium/cobalt transporter CorA [Sulfurospirillaceae bacterium]|nr:magnesium/cobalt transporter CorA [Sulfurospirillaceae bacterium]
MLEKIGLSPGSTIYTGDIEKENPLISITTFDLQNVDSKNYESIEETLRAYSNISKDTKAWIHIEPISDEEKIAKLCSLFNLHSLVAEDILSVNHRPKVDEYDDYIFVVVKYAVFENHVLNFYQISFVLKGNQVICFADKSPDRFSIIQKRLEKLESRGRKSGSQYLLFALIDLIVDDYFLVLEEISEEIEDLEDEIIYSPTKRSIEHVHLLKRNLTNLKKSIWPMREVINTLMRSDSIEDQYRMFYKDLYDHIIDIIDIIEGYRDSVSGFLDIYLSTLSNRMNEIMKTLSIIATIFIPLSFLTGYFGMNFKAQTILESASAYHWTNLSMIAIPLALLGYFKLRKWF